MPRTLRWTAVVLLAVAAACGGDDEPSEAEVIEQFTEDLAGSAQFEGDQASCVADEIVGELGVDGIRDLGETVGSGGGPEDLSDEQRRSLQDLITRAYETCGVGGSVVDEPDPTDDPDTTDSTAPGDTTTPTDTTAPTDTSENDAADPDGGGEPGE